jgi:hypothetical protein
MPGLNSGSIGLGSGTVGIGAQGDIRVVVSRRLRIVGRPRVSWVHVVVIVRVCIGGARGNRVARICCVVRIVISRIVGLCVSRNRGKQQPAGEQGRSDDDPHRNHLLSVDDYPFEHPVRPSGSEFTDRAGDERRRCHVSQQYSGRQKDGAE